MIHSLMRRARSRRAPSLVQKHQLCANERQDTKGADPRTEHGANVGQGGLLGGCRCVPALPVCAFVSLASILVPPAFVVRDLLWGACCAAWLCCRFRCARLRSLLFSLRLTGHRPKNWKHLSGNLRVYFTWNASQENSPKAGFPTQERCVDPHSRIK